MRIVVLGGGTGTFTVLSGLKHHPAEVAAIVSIADNGGSTGQLRDELGVLPPGDIRQCLVALSAGDDVLRRLFMYHFQEGSLAGHSFGNIFLSALEKISGDALHGVAEAHRILDVRGRVIPVSGCAANVCVELEDGAIVTGERAIEERAPVRAPIKRCFLAPAVFANPDALRAINEADAVVLGPGDVYTSLIPVLLVDGVREALESTRAQRMYVVNLTTKPGQTDGLSAEDHCRALTGYLGRSGLDIVIMNTAPVPAELLERYQDAGECLVPDDLQARHARRIIRAPIIAELAAPAVPGDRLARSLIRHDPKKLAQTILDALSGQDVLPHSLI